MVRVAIESIEKHLWAEASSVPLKTSVRHANPPALLTPDFAAPVAGADDVGASYRRRNMAHQAEGAGSIAERVITRKTAARKGR
jgi:hypothetical protein